MKNLSSLPFIFVPLLLATTAAMAQTAVTPCSESQQTVSTDTLARFTLFTGIFLEGKTYLHWDTRDQQCDGIYTVYRSQDGMKFETVGHRKGVGVPISLPIAWYLQDQDPPAGTSWYKVVHQASDNTCLASKIISVTRMITLLTQTE